LIDQTAIELFGTGIIKETRHLNSSTLGKSPSPIHGIGCKPH
jgi:hypothetical protein